jgi:asparagine synthase (glutamine-hydrolysing)
MPAWVVLSWNPEDPAAIAEAAGHAAKLDSDPHWTLRWRGARAAVWSEAGGRVTIRALPGGRGVLVGDLHAQPGSAAGSFEVLLAGMPDDPIAAARRLTGGAWGAYGVVFCGADGQVGVYRDPCGGREVLTWILGRVVVAAGDLYLLPTALWPQRLALDWNALARQMAEPGLTATAPIVAGLDSVLPGTLWDPRAGRTLATIWTPADHADRFKGDLDAARDALGEVVRQATQALAADHPRLIGELSGGVDSAIVAAAAGPAAGLRMAALLLNVPAGGRRTSLRRRGGG